ncbi:MAG: hypothetical protein BGO41_00840 [Clostridiales bacterium 38-18]|nr:MAG: hypothetical protein BGO41_00840 [Clostridiales bacterium 38-18]
MTYRDYMIDKLKRNQRINKYLIANVALVIITLMVFMDSMVVRGIFIGVMAFTGWIVTLIILKTKKTNQQKREVMINAHGDDLILAKGDDYFGMISTDKKGRTLLLLVYLMIMLVCLTCVYDVLEMSVAAIVIVDALHVLLMSPILFILKEGLLQTAIFTSSSIIIRDVATIDLQKRFKFQFFELMDGKYILEINSGERFQRFCIDKEAFFNIADLFN